MLRQCILLLVGLSVVIANPITRQVGLSDDVKVTVRNNTSEPADNIAEPAIAETPSETAENGEQEETVPEAEENPSVIKDNSNKEESQVIPEEKPESSPIEASEAEQQTEASLQEEESVRTETQTEAAVEDQESTEATFNQETVLGENTQPEIKDAEETVSTDSPNERQEEESTTEAEVAALEGEDSPVVKNTNEDTEEAGEVTASPSVVDENIVAKNSPILSFQENVNPSNLGNSELFVQFAGKNDETQTEAQPEAEERTSAPESAEVQTEANAFEGFPEENWDKQEGETEASEAHTESNAELAEALEANTEGSVADDEVETESPSVARTEALAEGSDDEATEVETEAPVERNQPQTDAPVEASEAETEAPVERNDAETEAPAEASEAETEAPVEASEADTEAPIEASEAETQASVRDTESETEASVDFLRAESITETEESESQTEIAEAAESQTEPEVEASEVVTEAVISEAETKGELNEVAEETTNREEDSTDSILMFREPNPTESVGVVKVSVNGKDFVTIKEDTTENEDSGDVVTEAVHAPSIDDHNYWLMMNQGNQAQETELKGEEIVGDNVEKEIAKVAEKYGLRTSVRNPASDATQAQATKTEQRLQFNELRRKRGYMDSLAQYVAHFF